MKQNWLFPPRTTIGKQQILTHTRRGSDGVSAGDERLSLVQADENVHGPAGRRKKPLKSTPKGNNNLLGQKRSGRYIIPMVLMYAVYVPLTQGWLHRRLE